MVDQAGGRMLKVICLISSALLPMCAVTDETIQQQDHLNIYQEKGDAQELGLP
jgi:hypothetical protein